MNLYGFIADIDIGDFNADGMGDLAIAMWNSNSVASGTSNSNFIYTCRSTGAGACTPEAWGMEQYGGGGIFVADLNNDSLPDIIQGGRLGNRLYYRSISRFINTSY